jgi:translation initiation factor 2 alpha subunit (eIF-2alpha)
MVLTNETFRGPMKAVTLYGVLQRLPEDQIKWLSEVHKGYVKTVRELISEGRKDIIYNGKVLNIDKLRSLPQRRKQ